MDWTLMDLFCS